MAHHAAYRVHVRALRKDINDSSSSIIFKTHTHTHIIVCHFIYFSKFLFLCLKLHAVIIIILSLTKIVSFSPQIVALSIYFLFVLTDEEREDAAADSIKRKMMVCMMVSVCLSISVGIIGVAVPF